MVNRSLHDQFNRPLQDLRISVTDRCNFRCRYCMPEEIFGHDYMFLSKKEILSFEEIERLVSLMASFGVKKVRITGGEPLMRKDLSKLIFSLKKIDGIKDVALTTNGSLLRKHAQALKEAGLERINVSLDTLDNEVFHRLNSRSYSVEDVLEGIELAAALDIQVKVNMVVQKGVNEQDIVPMARYFRNTPHILRFIEFMDVGNHNGWNLERVVSKKEIIRIIDEKFPLEPVKSNYYGEVASRYRYKEGGGEIGVISSVTDSFCSSCTRARLSADGHLYMCLFAVKGHDLRTLLRSGADDEEMIKEIGEIWRNRHDRYSDERLLQTDRDKRAKIEMSYIGG